jgi:hypothetical protein
MADLPVTTIPPFADTAKLPACAVNCGALYDANGACVPPAAPVGEASAYTACFCSHGAVAPLSTAVTGVCDNVCQPNDLSSVQGWFQGICGVQNNNNNGGGGNGGNNNGNGGDSGSGNGDSGNSNGNTGGSTGHHKGIQEPTGDWLSNHWQWVIMLVILVVGIAGIWIGACIWRRRHLKKKDRQSTLPQKQSGSVSHPSWGPEMDRSGAPPAASGPGVFMPGSTTASPTPYEEKSKKKWTVNERT